MFNDACPQRPDVTKVTSAQVQEMWSPNPGFFLFRTRMRKGMAQVTLANSITLTPGTITVNLEDGHYIIHTLKPPLAQELADAVMQNKVAKIYLEKKETPPATRWVYSLEELEA